MKTKKSPSPWKKGRGFTLIELLVVVAIIGLIASIVLVNLTGNTDKARLARAKQFHGQVTHALSHEAVGIWRFEEGTVGASASTTLDSSGYGKHGTILGASLPFWVSGVWPGTKALGLTGSQAIDLETRAVDLGNDWTILVWFPYPNGGLEESGSYRTLTQGAGNQHQVLVNTGSYTLGAYSGSFIACDPEFKVDSFKSDGAWHHMAVVQSGGALGKMEYYIDGKKVCQISELGYTTEVKVIGNEIGLGQEWGTIDDVYIFSIALSVGQIQQLYAEGLKRHTIAQQE